MAKFVTLHYKGRPRAFNIERISEIYNQQINLRRNTAFICYVDETFDEIMNLINEANGE